MLLPGQLRRWITRSPIKGVLTEGDLITIVKVWIVEKDGEEWVSYVSRYGLGQTPAHLIERYSERLDPPGDPTVIDGAPR